MSIDPDDAKSLDAAIDAVVAHARQLQRVARGSDSDATLNAKSALQVLCAHREGSMGVAGWNARVEKRLGVRATDPRVYRPICDGHAEHPVVGHGDSRFDGSKTAEWYDFIRFCEP